MAVVCWSPKGGSGTSVVAAALAASTRPSLLVDLAGDAGAVVGVDDAGPGIAGWVEAAAEAPPDALGRLEVPVADGFALLVAGRHTVEGPEDAGRLLMGLLGVDPRHVVIDAGRAESEMSRAVVLSATRSLCVLRPCYPALRRVATCGLPVNEIVLVTEPGRALGRGDVEAATRAPVVAEVPWDPAIARSVDAATLVSRTPRVLRRSLGALVPSSTS